MRQYTKKRSNGIIFFILHAKLFHSNGGANTDVPYSLYGGEKHLYKYDADSGKLHKLSHNSFHSMHHCEN